MDGIFNSMPAKALTIKGTIIVIARYREGLVIGADKVETVDDVITDNEIAKLRILNNNIVIGIVGVSDRQLVNIPGRRFNTLDKVTEFFEANGYEISEGVFNSLAWHIETEFDDYLSRVHRSRWPDEDEAEDKILFEIPICYPKEDGEIGVQRIFLRFIKESREVAAKAEPVLTEGLFQAFGAKQIVSLIADESCEHFQVVRSNPMVKVFLPPNSSADSIDAEDALAFVKLMIRLTADYSQGEIGRTDDSILLTKEGIATPITFNPQEDASVAPQNQE